jgi:predicted DNA-binding ribbon-helix-helix protein
MADNSAKRRHNGLPGVSKSLWINGRRTTLRLEKLFWETFLDICAREKLEWEEMLELLDRRRGEATLARALRLFTVSYCRAAAPPVSWDGAGHGGTEAPSPGAMLSRAFEILPAKG